MREKANVTVDSFYRAWQEDLDVVRKQLGSKLEDLPRVTAELRATRVSRSSRQVFYSVTVQPAPENQNAVVSFMHYHLPPYDEEVDEQLLLREQSTLAAVRERELPGGYSQGQRLFYSGAYDCPELDCQVISGWKRMELR
jgi:hypothetical protein